MCEKESYCKNFDLSVKEFEEKYGDLAKIALEETSGIDLHKLLKKGDFSLPEEVREELRELEMADLTDLKKEKWKN